MSKKIAQLALALIVLTNTNPVLAASKQQNALSNQKLDYQENSKNMLVAGGFFRDVMRTINDIDKTRDGMERREQQKRQQEEQRRYRQRRNELQIQMQEQMLLERQARELERQRMQEELAYARRAATQRQLEEAERRRQYFESLSPQQKQAYIQQQQQLRQKQAEANLFLLGTFINLLTSGGGSQQAPNNQYIYIHENNVRPNSNPAPAPVQPIHSNYGSCHHYSC